MMFFFPWVLGTQLGCIACSKVADDPNDNVDTTDLTDTSDTNTAIDSGTEADTAEEPDTGVPMDSGTVDCPDNEIADCQGLCVPQVWLSNGQCDHNAVNFNHEYGLYSLMCEELNWDNGDCLNPELYQCSDGEVVDCAMSCTSELKLGNNECTPAFDCTMWANDNGDCLEPTE